jgi:hypothetical protein
MKLEQLFLLHLMAGVGVAVCVYLSASGRGVVRWFQALAAIFFWPLFLPLLLSDRTKTNNESSGQLASGSLDELDRTIAQVDAELEVALQSLDGWGENLRERGQERLQELRSTWIAQAGRVREMDQIMARSWGVQQEGDLWSGSVRVHESQEMIHKNLERLRQVRQRTLDDLIGMLARVRELVSMIHLARFTGAPASRAEELVGQLGAIGKGVPATTWQQEFGKNEITETGIVREEICHLNRQ